MARGTSGRSALAFGNSSRPVMPGMLMSDRIRISDTSAASGLRKHASLLGLDQHSSTRFRKQWFDRLASPLRGAARDANGESRWLQSNKKSRLQCYHQSNRAAEGRQKILVMARRSSPKKLKLATFLSQCGLVTVPVAGSALRLSNGSSG